MRKQKILIVLFAGSLVLPGVVWTGFSGRFDTENNENRKLAEFPEVNLESLGDFPEQFEAYYKDHVPFKNDLVKFCNFIDTEFFRNTKIGDVVIGEDNWLFYLPEREGENAMADYQKTNVYTLEQSAEIASGIAKVRDWFLNRGVEQFHYYVAPNKETLYSKYMPEKPKVIGIGDSRMETFAKYMKENSDVEFDFLADYLREFTEKYQLFRKYDTHMNNLGGYITNEKIVQDMTGESLPIEDIQVMIGTKPCRGDLSRMIGRYKELDDDREYGLKYFHDGIRYKVKKEESEGGEEILESVNRILSAGIPVMGHLGLTPQSIHKFGTYNVRAKDEEEAEKLVRDAHLLEDAGCFAIVLEKIPAALGTRVASELRIPIIGIGAGGGVDGQVLVIHDMLGINKGFSPRFLRRYADLHEVMTGAVTSYVEDVKSGDFPNESEQY